MKTSSYVKDQNFAGDRYFQNFHMAVHLNLVVVVIILGSAEDTPEALFFTLKASFFYIITILMTCACQLKSSVTAHRLLKMHYHQQYATAKKTQFHRYVTICWFATAHKKYLRMLDILARLTRNRRRRFRQRILL